MPSTTQGKQREAIDAEARKQLKINRNLRERLESEKQLNKTSNKQTMSKSFSTSIKSAATGSGLANLIPASDADLLQRTREEIDYIETNPDKAKAGRKPRTDKDNKNAPAAEKGTKPGEMRKTYLVNKDTAEDLESIAYWERETIKDVINRALSAYVKEYALDSKNKSNVTASLRIKPIPKK